MSMEVKLGSLERQLAVIVGGVRQVRSIQQNLTPAYGRHAATFDGFDLNIQAAGAEIATAKALNLYFEPHYDRFTGAKDKDGKPLPDLQPDLAVRWTGRWENLLIHQDDPEVHRYILVRGNLVQGYLVGGWAHGYELGDLEGRVYDENGREPCLLIAPGKLRPLAELELGA